MKKNWQTGAGLMLSALAFVAVVATPDARVRQAAALRGQPEQSQQALIRGSQRHDQDEAAAQQPLLFIRGQPPKRRPAVARVHVHCPAVAAAQRDKHSGGVNGQGAIGPRQRLHGGIRHEQADVRVQRLHH